MTKVKIRNLVAMILQSVITMTLFIDGTLVTEVWKIDSPARGHNTFEIAYAYSFLQKCIDNDSLIGFLALALALGGVVLFLLQFVGKDKKTNTALAAYVPLAEFVLVVISVITFSGTVRYGKTEYRDFPGAVFYVCAVALLVLAVGSVVSYTKIKKQCFEEMEI